MLWILAIVAQGFFIAVGWILAMMLFRKIMADPQGFTDKIKESFGGGKGEIQSVEYVVVEEDD